MRGVVWCMKHMLEAHQKLIRALGRATDWPLIPLSIGCQLWFVMCNVHAR